MKTTRIERRAQKLQLATGMAWTTALDQVRKLAPTAPLLPEANADLAPLESGILNHLAWPSISTRHPWGIRKVDPRPDSLVITFENEDINREVPGESMTRHLVRALPRFDTRTGEPTGIPGARFTIENGHVVIRQIDAAGSVTLAGFDVAEWFTALDLQTRDDESAGLTLSQHQSPRTLHSSEKLWWNTRDDESSWLASGLLRRAALLRTIGVPLSTTAWTNPAQGAGREWIVEYIHEPLVQFPLHHDGFATLLTDPECGLRIIETDWHCGCRMPREYGYGCHFYARSADGLPGELQVRFTRRLGNRLSRYKADSADYEARRKLYRRVPAQLLGGPSGAPSTA
ncbi:hypothetical protein G4Z16_01055 [Streptomyces bathyalis]|uniref:Uncharacterized protein n=1 Tax=Streptomyces bathyalis TaxID=2710756 RepID=A0A7T1T2I8_9ACTN|nr:hypothetical protein [Streptomyces bathyalis]QPP05206.1 hypothetical protein G4Z16_01055 [Streptomyces bathyalis]